MKQESGMCPPPPEMTALSRCPPGSVSGLPPIAMAEIEARGFVKSITLDGLKKHVVD